VRNNNKGGVQLETWPVQSGNVGSAGHTPDKAHDLRSATAGSKDSTPWGKAAGNMEVGRVTR